MIIYSLAILELRKVGKIEKLRNEHFNYQRTCTSETARAASASVNMDIEQIGLEAFGGLFIILGIAVAISPIVLLVEHIFKHICRNSIKTRNFIEITKKKKLLLYQILKKSSQNYNVFSYRYMLTYT